MVGKMDFVSSLERDMSFKILMSLDDPSDLARASCVSRAWRDFVVSQGLCKQLCLRKFTQLSSVDHVKVASNLLKNDAEAGCTSFSEWEKFRREHRIYAFFAHCCTTYPLRNCIFLAMSASSTDNFSRDIGNTLETRNRFGQMELHWSSKGQKDPSVPETLIYELVGDLCVISEIRIQPFEAFFEPGSPIYSASHVRFRVGYAENMVEILDVEVSAPGQRNHGCPNENYVWTYTSPEFPMAQENRLQTFKLEEPVLCVGGFILVELLGRVQRKEIDDLFYICVARVQVLGRCLSTSFAVEALQPSGNFVLELRHYATPTDKLPVHTRNTRRILNMLRGTAWGEGQDESDEEFV